MLGELMCHLTGFLGIPFEAIFFINCILWFIAGWIINGIRINKKWLSKAKLLDNESRRKITVNEKSSSKRKNPTKTIKRI